MKGTDALAFWCFLFSTITICAAVDSIGANESIGNGKTLVSPSEIFELGFFPSGSKNWYVGIWYKKVADRKVLWVANRDKPLNDTNGVLKVTEGGLLVLLDVEERTLWSTKSSRSPKNAVAQLLDTGNLVVKDESDDSTDDYLWQSFDYPCNVLLPGMKLGFNLVNGHEWSLSSWKSKDDPAPGEFSRRIDGHGYPQSITFDGSVVKSRLGPWNGIGFSGYTIVNPNDIIVSEFVISEEEIYYKFDLKNSTVFSILELQPDGVVLRWVWNGPTRGWSVYRNSETDFCDRYEVCGAYGSCSMISTDRCSCFNGFSPRWSTGADWAAGCARNTQLECGEKDVFIRHPSVKLPDTRNSSYDKSMSLGECKSVCSKNCSCTAYSNLDVLNGTGCLLWFDDLIDTKESSTNPQDIYLRLASTEVGIGYCDICTSCGAHGKCNISNTQSCECLEGFTPKNGEEWRIGNWSNGCVWATQPACGENSNFILQQNIKLPDTSMSLYNENKTLEECKTQCSSNCNCTAYARTDLKNGGTGCFLWSGELLDIGHCQTNGQDLYVRVPGGKQPAPRGNRNKLTIILVSAFLAAFSVLLVGLSVFLWKRNRQGKGNLDRIPDLKFYDFATIAIATNNFSEENKLGEGGFGPVYKGVLEDGLEIAVKKLARKTEQGDNEFKNEVIYIAKLQHRNLVKLLGYSLQGSEKVLVYEFLPHKSLDLFIFDPKQSKTLDWSKRLEIIKKTARGLLYLHEDSRLNIIHRDLKASNILLDRDMNPKISDFGTARSFREEELGGTTKRVVGTYGYISPEYAMDGIFSAKSDVYSYGVLVLEILSGRKNGRLHQPGHRLNLGAHAWNLFQEGRQMELIDASIRPPIDMNELLRAIHVGLLCVQHYPEDRPKMATVVLMLEGDRILPPPKEPGFYGDKNMLEAFMGETSSVRNDECSVNMISITHIEGR